VTKRRGRELRSLEVALAVIVVGCGVFSREARANYLSGTIGFSGSGMVTNSANVTTVTFATPQEVSSFNSGNYSVLPLGTPANIYTTFSFTNNGSSAILDSAPVSPLWSVTLSGTTFDFDLTGLTTATYTPAVMGAPPGLSLTGFGIAQESGFSDTPATYTLAGIYNPVAAVWNFDLSDQTSASQPDPVPDGGATLALLGTALAGVEFIRRAARAAREGSGE